MFILLLLLWLALFGSITIDSVVYGTLVAAALSAFCSRFIDHKPIHSMPVHTWSGYAAFLLYLLGQIALSCFTVLRMIWSRRTLKPTVIHFSVPLDDEMDCVLLANSITLTPGTITVSTHDNRLSVHALDAHLGKGIERCGFVRRLVELEEKKK